MSNTKLDLGSKDCAQCKRPFKLKTSNQLLCSESCRKEFYFRGRSFDIPTASVGSIAEMMICCEMLRRGYSVFRTVSNSSFCDVVAIKGTEHLFLEVRTAYRDTRGKLSYPLVLHNKISDPTHYALFIPYDGSIELIPISQEDIRKHGRIN